MSYNHNLADRIRARMAVLPNVEEKEMMGSIVFMFNGKMCVGVIKDEMMCRVDPEMHDSLVEKRGCRTMDFTSRPMKGYVLIDETGMRSEKDFEYWISLCIDFNSRAKSSKKRKPPKRS
jgi:TfoX/Sxy family transcriptional regulator of competence genes